MNKPKRMLSVAVVLMAFLLGDASACPEWNSRQFFEAASPKTVRSCLEDGANAQEMDADARTPLHWAAQYSVNPENLRMLLEAGANVHARDITGQTPLHGAAHSQYPTIVRTLLDAGGDVHAEDNERFTPLHAAASFNPNPAVLQELLSIVVDRTWGGASVLHSAASYQNNVEVLRVLLGRWAVRENINSPSRSSGATALHWAANSNGNPAIVRELLAFGAEVDYRTDRGRTPLHWAAYSNRNPAVLQELINAGANIESEDYDGLTPIWRAATGSPTNVEALQLLLSAGANYGHLHPRWGITILHWAAVNGRLSVLQELLASGADHCIEDVDGQTPLQWIEERTDRPEVAELLGEAGACR